VIARQQKTRTRKPYGSSLDEGDGYRDCGGLPVIFSGIWRGFKVRSVNRSALQLKLNEFYQKGCQEKTSASTGGEMFSQDPAHGD
jgi:hypothetical protein